ncbi:hypothetical protein [Streptomyces decoyicus]|uniref:hypothetical protein n=1 Tax=Streptomyces decoyicus TaxID=249567 RepID=UPI003868DD95|nr:hypothetical protein OG532_03355 [Streptomyces decoyicus]
MTTGRGVEMGKWTPVVYRGKGAWIGIMPDGRIGVGVELEGRATLEGSGFVPMWPFLERDFSECLGEFSRSWESIKDGGISTPEKLIELTVASAWNSGRQYWMRLSAPWVIEMAHRPKFDHEFIRELLGGMIDSEVLDPELRNQAQRANSS